MMSAHPKSPTRGALPDGVLVTRPAAMAGDTMDRLGAMGFAPVIAPCLTVQAVQPRLPEASALQAVLVTSGHVLASLPAAYHQLALLAVGDATAARARRAGFARVESADGDAAALSQLAQRLCPPQQGALLLATGVGLGSELAAQLRSRGFRVLRRVVYRSRPVARIAAPALHALRDGSLRSALFFSGETAHAFVRVLPVELRPALATVEALAIGRAVADALEPLPWRRIRVATRPTQDELLALLHE